MIMTTAREETQFYVSSNTHIIRAVNVLNAVLGLLYNSTNASSFNFIFTLILASLIF